MTPVVGRAAARRSQCYVASSHEGRSAYSLDRIVLFVLGLDLHGATLVLLPPVKTDLHFWTSVRNQLYMTQPLMGVATGSRHEPL